MTFFIWFQFALVCLIGAMSPGPSLAVVIRNNVNYNRMAGILTSLGHGLGIGVYATAAVLGLGFILQANQMVFLIIQISGLCFLFFLGRAVLSILAKWSILNASPPTTKAGNFSQKKNNHLFLLRFRW